MSDTVGVFAVAKLERQKEPKSLNVIKDGIVKDFGMLELLDIFVEADRLVDFTRFFTHSGTKQVRSRDALRPVLILDLFAEGTNMGIKRMANSNDRYSYDYCVEYAPWDSNWLLRPGALPRAVIGPGRI